MIRNRSSYYALTVVTASWLASCFSAPPDVAFDAGPADAKQIDATITSCTPSTTVCDDALSTYVECDATGTPTFTMHCPLGCSTTSEKCVDVDPSNGLAVYMDEARSNNSVLDVTFTGNSTLNTDTGAATSAGVSVTIPSATANGIRVFMFKSLSVPGTLKVTGAFAAALISYGDVTVTGSIDVSADGPTQGPGAIATNSGSTCVGGSFIAIGSVDEAGGGGGGHFQAGKAGGSTFDSSTPGAGGAMTSTPALEPLVGGCPGGESRHLLEPPPPYDGGGGGGGLQITARGTISLTGGASIDASGGGGGGSGGGGGGGAGGNVLLEAPSITIDGAGVVISTKGGGGAAADANVTQGHGQDGGTTGTVAGGGTISGYAPGGAGGTETTAPVQGGLGNSTHHDGAGGGGGVGEARFNNASGAVAATNGAAIRSHFTEAQIATRLLP